MKRYHFLFAFFILAVSCEKTNNINDKTTIENNYYDKAYDFLAKSEKDSAFIYFNLAKNIFSQNNDSVRVGNCLVNMAIIEGEKGDYFGSQETALSAIIYLDENELKLHPIIYSNYNNLGIVANNLKDFKNSLIWYEKALKISDNEQKQTIYNNIAMVNSRSDHYSKALNILKSLQANLNDSKNINSKTRILDNLAYTKFLQNKNYNAEPELNKALEIREIEKDLWGQNASHAHLSDYFEAKNTEKALFHAHKMYEIASRLKSPDDQIESLQKLVNLENSENLRDISIFI